MQKGHLLEFTCLDCSSPVKFSVFELDAPNCQIHCSHCIKSYILNDEILIRQIKKFANLCRAIKESEEILSSTSVGVTVGDREIKIPYKILLTRMGSCLDLNIGGQNISIYFRFEPLTDTQELG